MSKQFFSGLNYTLANEDSSFEMSIVRPKLEHVLSVAGSGARVLPLFTSKPEKLTCVDLSKEQLLLTELRIESCRTFEFEDYLCFWGYPPIAEDARRRRELFSNLKLSDDCKRMFLSLFERRNWASILYDGKWERAFLKIAQLCQSVLGDTVHELFQSEDYVHHRTYMRESFPYWKWRLLVFLIGNSSFFNSLLYKGSFPIKNVEGSHFRYYFDAYNRIFDKFLPRDNFFLQMTLFGRLKYESGNPIECRKQVFYLAQEGIRGSQVSYCFGNVVDLVEHNKDTPINFVSLSDVPSYFDDETSLRFLTRMRSGLADEAEVVARYYLREIHDPDLSGFDEVTSHYKDIFATELTQMYRVAVFRKYLGQGGR